MKVSFCGSCCALVIVGALATGCAAVPVGGGSRSSPKSASASGVPVASSPVSSATPPSAPFTTSSSAATAPACGPSQLKVALAHVIVGLGTVGGYFSFTNVSGNTCQLTGWPDVAGIEPDGSASVARDVLSTAFGPQHLTGAPVVVLKPGATADGAFHGTDVQLSSGPCPPPYRYFRVAPPGMTLTIQMSAWLASFGQYMPACGGLQVLPLLPSTAFGD